MGRKRKTSSTASTRKNKKNQVNIDLLIIGLAVLTLLLFILIYGQKGTIGQALSPTLGGMMGLVKYILPIIMLGLTVSLAKAKNNVTSKLIEWVVLFACVCGALSVYQISKGYISADLEFNSALEVAFDLGTRNIGGGTIGTVLAYPLVQLFDVFGASVILYGAVLLLVVFMFGLSPMQIFSNLAEGYVERQNEAANADRYRQNEMRQRRATPNQNMQDPAMMRQNTRGRKPQENMQTSIMDDEIVIDDLRINGKTGQEEIMQNSEHGITRGVRNFFLKNKHPKAEMDVDDDPEYIEANLHKAAAEENVNNARNNLIEMSSHEPEIRGNVVDKEPVSELHSEASAPSPSAGFSDNLFDIEEEKKEAKTKAVLNLEHTIAAEEDNYEYPPINILSRPKKGKGVSRSTLNEKSVQLQKTLRSFGVNAKVENISTGPAITRFEIKPAEGVRVSKIANLTDDIALSLAAESIRIEAPIPGKQAVGIEIPNKEKEMVTLREVIESQEFEESTSKLSVGLGKDITGNVVMADIAKMPHVLIAGSTGSGKSVCINTIITSLIYKAKPSEVKMIMVDPKVVELSVYNEIPHLMIPVVTDPRKAAGALAWAVQEMDNRYTLFAQKGVRDLKGYNKLIEEENENIDNKIRQIEESGEDMQEELAEEIINRPTGKLPQMVIIVDELADLMMVAAKEVEESICRLAQKARAAGMHLIIATQRPSVDVITGLIKANVPSRIAFAVSSQIDSRTILDQGGAEKLLGKGDMLYYPVGTNKPHRVQGAFVSDEEVEKIVDFVKANGVAKYNEDVLESIENAGKSDGEKDLAKGQASGNDMDPLLPEVIEMCVEVGKASTSHIQRKFSVGFNRAGRIIDQMEERGVVGPYEGTKARKILLSMEDLQRLKATDWLGNNNNG